MINTKKMITLGVLAVTGLGLMGTTTAYAATTGGGSTTVSYEPGKSTGTDDNTGEVADWTVEYPITSTVDDTNIAPESAKPIQFSLLKSSDKTSPYEGSSSVNVFLKKMATSDVSNGAILMKHIGSGTDTGTQAKLGLADLSGSTGTDITLTDLTTKSVKLTTLNGTDKTKKVGLYLKDKDTAKKNNSYSAGLTWVFTTADSVASDTQ